MATLHGLPDCCITFVRKEPSPFIRMWVQLQKPLASDLHNSLQNLGPILEQAPIPQPSQLCMSSIYFVRCMDNIWYRAQPVPEQAYKQDCVRVQLIDFGTVTDVSFQCFRLMPGIVTTNRMHEMAPLAQEFILADILPFTPEWVSPAFEKIRDDLEDTDFFYQIIGSVQGNRLLRLFTKAYVPFAKIMIEMGLGRPAALETMHGMVPAPPPGMVYNPVPPMNLGQPPLDLGHLNQQNAAAAMPMFSQSIMAAALSQAANYNPRALLPALPGQVPPCAEVPSAAPPPATPTKSFFTKSLLLYSKHQVSVSNVTEGPLKFQIQLKETEASLSQLMKQLEQQPLIPFVGPATRASSCLVRFSEDGKIYRGLILSVAGNGCKVYYVDYGNTEMVPSNQLYHMPSEQLKEKVMAIRCTLWGIKSYAVLPNTHNTFMDLVLDKQLSCKVMPSSEADNTEQAVQLFLDERSILDTLLFMKAIQDKREHYAEHHLALGATEVVMVSFVNGATNFHCQVVSNLQNIDALFQQVQLIANHYEGGPMCPSEMLKGTPCCAKFSEDACWYRAEIKSPPDNGKVEVTFVDYGNSESVDLSMVISLIKELLNNQPRYAYHCTLDGLSNMDLPEEMMREMSLDKNMQVRVVSREADGTLVVNLARPEDSINVNNMLLAAHFGLEPNCLVLEPLKNKEMLQVVCVEKPPIVFAQLKKYTQEELEKFGEELQEVYQYSQNSPSLYADQQSHLGELGVAWVDVDQHFYRVKVIGEAENHVSVRMLDYGKCLDIPKVKLYHLETRFIRRPAFGMRCKITNVPANVSAEIFPKVMPNLPMEFVMGSIDGDMVNVSVSDMTLWTHLCDAVVGKYQEQRHAQNADNDWNDAGNRASTVDDMQQGSSWNPRGSLGKKHFDRNEEQGRFSSRDSSGSRWNANRNENKRELNSDRGDRWGSRNDGGKRFGSRSQEAVDFDDRKSDSGSVNSFRSKGGLHNDRTRDRPFNRDKGASFGDNASTGNLEAGDWKGDNSSGAFKRKMQSSSPREMPKPPLHSYPSLEPLPGSKEDVMVSWYNDPNDFYVQVYSNKVIFSQMMDGIQNEYGVLGDSEWNETNTKEGIPVIAKFPEDNAWYRAEIKRDAGHQVHIFYVDYGNSLSRNKSELKRVTLERLIVARQAIHCSLKGISSLGPVWKPCEFLTAKKKYFMHNSLHCLFWEKKGDIYEVELFLDGKSIAQILLAEGLACTIEDKAQALDAFPVIDASKCLGQSVEVIVTHVKDMQNFFCQLDQASLKSILEVLSKFVKEENGKAKQVPIIKGSCCIVKDNKIDAWRRAEISHLESATTVRVVYVDYGNEEEVAVDKVAFMPDNLKDVPRQAILCCLKDGKADQAADIFKEVSLNKKFMASVHSIEGRKLIITMLGEDDVPITEKVNQLLAQLSKSDAATTEAVVPQEVSRDGSVVVPPFKIPDTTTFLVYVSHTDSPAAIWVQLNTIESALTELVDSLYNAYEHTDPVETEHLELTPGKFCAVRRALDGNWYRCQVIESCSDSTIRVTYCDYGDSDTVHVADVRPLLPEFAVQPCFALKVSLAIEPVSDETWSSEASAVISELTGDGTVEATVQLTDTGVECVAKMLVGELNAAQVLIEKGLAQLPESAEKTKTDEEVSSKLAEGKLVRATDTVVSPFQVPDTAPFVVYVSHVESPRSIYVQLDTIESALAELLDSLYNTYEHMSPAEIGLLDLTPGKFCAARRSSDGNWYRCQVMEASDDGTVKVLFCDYGDTDAVELENVHHLLPELAAVSCFALKVSLAVEPVSEDEMWSSEASDVIHEVTGDGSVAVTVQLIETGDECVAKVLVGELDLASLLVEKGLARVEVHDEVEPVIVPPFTTLGQEETFTAFISHVNNPNSVWIQKESDSDKIEELAQKINDYYDDNLKQPVKRVKAGTFWAAQSDGGWSRVMILSKEVSTVIVRFCDSGRDASIPLEALQPLAPDFAVEPCMALEVILNIQPEDEKGSWSKDAANFINSITEFGNIPGKVAVVGKDTQSVPLVNIQIGASDLAAELISLTIAKFVPVKSFPEVGSEAVVIVSVVETPSDFWVHLCEESGAQKLDGMRETLDSVDGSVSQLTEIPKKGEHCLARWSEDCLLYRAEVTDVRGNDVEVVMFDYGTKDVLDLKSLFAVPEDMPDLPPMAYACQLEERPLGTWTDEAIQRFRVLSGVDAEAPEPRIVRVKEKRGKYVVNVISYGKMIGELLKQEGFTAVEIETKDAKDDDAPRLNVSVDDTVPAESTCEVLYADEVDVYDEIEPVTENPFTTEETYTDFVSELAADEQVISEVPVESTCENLGADQKELDTVDLYDEVEPPTELPFTAEGTYTDFVSELGADQLVEMELEIVDKIEPVTELSFITEGIYIDLVTDVAADQQVTSEVPTEATCEVLHQVTSETQHEKIKDGSSEVDLNLPVVVDIAIEVNISADEKVSQAGVMDDDSLEIYQSGDTPDSEDELPVFLDLAKEMPLEAEMPEAAESTGLCEEPRVLSEAGVVEEDSLEVDKSEESAVEAKGKLSGDIVSGLGDDQKEASLEAEKTEYGPLGNEEELDRSEDIAEMIPLDTTDEKTYETEEAPVENAASEAACCITNGMPAVENETDTLDCEVKVVEDLPENFHNLNGICCTSGLTEEPVLNSLSETCVSSGLPNETGEISSFSKSTEIGLPTDLVLDSHLIKDGLEGNEELSTDVGQKTSLDDNGASQTEDENFAECDTMEDSPRKTDTSDAYSSAEESVVQTGGAEVLKRPEVPDETCGSTSVDDIAVGAKTE